MEQQHQKDKRTEPQHSKSPLFSPIFLIKLSKTENDLHHEKELFMPLSVGVVKHETKRLKTYQFVMAGIHIYQYRQIKVVV